MTKQLIVGIDPGTTVGYAILDLDGNLIQLGSEKHCTLKDLISKTIWIGDIIIVGTDRKQTPYFVSQFATKVGARLYHPKKDLLVSEKRSAVSNFKTNNYHELDALASAIFASNEIRGLLTRIDNFIRIYSKEHIKDQIRKKVILEGINIKDAAEILESKEAQKTNIQPLKKEIAKTTPEVEELRNRIRAYERDIAQITRYNKKLLRYIKKLKLRLETLTQSSQIEVERKLKSGLYFKDIKIASLTKKLDEKDGVIYTLKKSADTLNIILSDIRGNAIIKKLPDLNYNTYELYNHVLNIQHGDMLFVGNPNEYSARTIEILKDKVGIIIHRAQPNKYVTEQLPFIFINANEIPIIEDKFYCAVNKNALEVALKKQNLLSKVVENYRKSRTLER